MSKELIYIAMALHQSNDNDSGGRGKTRVLPFSLVLLFGLFKGRLLLSLLLDQNSPSPLSIGFLRDAQSLFLRNGIIDEEVNREIDDRAKDDWTPDVIFGNYSMPITFDTKNSKGNGIQKSFDVGLVECFGFCFFEARKTAQSILNELDDSKGFCPMCYWLLAMGHSPYVNHPIIANQSDFESAHKAATLAFEQARLNDRLSRKEMGLIDALNVRFSSPSTFENQTIGYVSYMNELRDLHKQILDENGTGDADVIAFLADSIMVLHADADGYNFYDETTLEPKPEIAYAIGLLEDCFDINPNHPLCQHLYIHITEPSHKMAPISGPIADNLLSTTAAGEAQHLQHMPSHTYLRIGRYHDAVMSNVIAHASDHEYERHGAVAYAVAHDLVVLLCAANLNGEKKVALEYSDILRDNYRNHPNRGDGPGTEVGWHVWRTIRLGFGDFDQVLRDSDEIPGGKEENVFSDSTSSNDLVWPYAVVLGHYSKGVASLWNTDPLAGNDNRLSRAKYHLTKLREASQLVDSDYHGMVSVADSSLDASIKFYPIHKNTTKSEIDHYKTDDLETVLELFQKARVEQDSWTYTEPPLWHSNLKLCEGTLLRIMGRYNESLYTFEAELIDWPENRYALYGLWQVLKEQGASTEKIRDIYDRFEDSSSYADTSVKIPLVCPELGE